MNIFLSQKFKVYSFLSMVFLVYVHGYNLQNTYLQSFTMVYEDMTFTTFTEYLFSNGLLRFRIPMLFIISGYLFALSDYKSYKERTLKRLKTLGLPYILWSLLALLFVFLLEFTPAKIAIEFSHLAWGVSKQNILLVSQYTWEDYFSRVLTMPIAFQLWFIRALLIFNIAYPPIKWCVQKYPIIWFIIVTLLWLTSFELPFISETGLLFFSLGVFLQKINFNIEKPNKYLNPVVFGFIFIISALLKTYLAFKVQYSFSNIEIVLHFLYKITELSGLISVWYGGNALVKWLWNSKVFQFCSPFTFMIYVLHVPALYFVVYASDNYFINYQYHRIFTYLFIPLLITLFSIVIGFILRKVSPTIYGILTGGRGL
jgi:fucose 4-O-acetylase-like acetyltransferase